ncbi:hypothetical protein [Streptomyces sp. NPDC054797]
MEEPRDRQLKLTLLKDLLRVEVSDARGDRRPAVQPHAYQAESGYGLRIVDAVATDWGLSDRLVGKTVGAELIRRGRPRLPAPIPRCVAFEPAGRIRLPARP